MLSEARERNPQEGRSRLRRKRTGHGAAPKLWEQLTPFTFRALLRLCPALCILVHLTVLYQIPGLKALTFKVTISAIHLPLSLPAGLLSSVEDPGGPARPWLSHRHEGAAVAPDEQGHVRAAESALPNDTGRREHFCDNAVAAFPFFRSLSALVTPFWVCGLFISNGKRAALRASRSPGQWVTAAWVGDRQERLWGSLFFPAFVLPQWRAAGVAREGFVLCPPFVPRLSRP